ncbi:MAG: hypothetical protein AUJ85_02440 [Elusimicrobia bacterium CG1_02_37_114]|nr:MAG: hypothetical protein AUJ85_02440 [Elusimicrobia bacterium CG1_02_37_114]PIV53773.1 MAG: DUF4416 domain-containing protein [Elusimicrobia bacterium CG02_land_8_20_14_3_00_37_13]PIZ13325.1 MAG: DUF4416 domain-containing protein [Elusimicrobia bacterium CG_4_10_14_0_8_um_filter_37_32]
MGKIKPPDKVKLIIGILFPGQEDTGAVEAALVDLYGRIDLKSEVMPFDFTDYYSEEMGGNLLRYWLGFERQILPGDISEIKVKTNEIEDTFGSINGKRKINIDPGYISSSTIVLTSTKNYSHRIYLDKGIYAEVTLIYEHGDFKTLPWTYPDYKTDTAKQFFLKARKSIK